VSACIVICGNIWLFSGNLASVCLCVCGSSMHHAASVSIVIGGMDGSF
jgi:hypothetical protein